MKKVINWFRCWTNFFRASKQVYDMEDRLVHLEKLRSKSDKELKLHNNNLESLYDDFKDEYEKIKISLKNATITNDKLSVALEAAHEQLKIDKAVKYLDLSI